MYAELMGYNIPVLRALVSDFNAEVHVIKWDKNNLTKYKAPQLEGVIFYERSTFKNSDAILALTKKINPDLAYVPNWFDRGYLKSCAYLRKNDVPVVSGLDNQWQGTLKQRLGIILMKVYLKRYFSHIWVAGPYQYEFASRLGFDKSKILYNLYCADVDKFSAGTPPIIKREKGLRFLFVGRLEEVKGLRDLIKAWKNFEHKDSCSLTLIGDGSLLPFIKEQKDINHIAFLQPEKLVVETKKYDCFILPSLFEPYGVVVHEFACAGMPLIVSDKVGAAPVFVVPHYNGFIFKAGDHNSLLEKMNLIYNKLPEELLQMKVRSMERSKMVTPQISAASFVSARVTHSKK